MGMSATIITAETKEQIIRAAEEFAYYNTDRQENYNGSYHGDLTFKNITFEDIEEAKEYLEKSHERYRDIAVQYKAYSKVSNKSIEKQEKRIKELSEDLQSFSSKPHFANHSSKLVSCKHCESKINSEFLKHTNFCPVCRKDLRPQSTLDRIKSKQDKITELNKKLKLDKKNVQKKAKYKVKWAALVSVHC